MKLESPSISQKRFFCWLQTLNILQHRNELNFLQLLEESMSHRVSLSVVSLLLLLFLLGFFFLFFVVCNLSHVAAEGFFFDTVEKKTPKHLHSGSAGTASMFSPRAELGPLNTTLAFSPPASVFSWEEVTLIWHGYIHNERGWLRRRVSGGLRGGFVALIWRPPSTQSRLERKGKSRAVGVLLCGAACRAVGGAWRPTGIDALVHDSNQRFYIGAAVIRLNSCRIHLHR